MNNRPVGFSKAQLITYLALTSVTAAGAAGFLSVNLDEISNYLTRLFSQEIANKPLKLKNTQRAELPIPSKADRAQFAKEKSYEHYRKHQFFLDSKNSKDKQSQQNPHQYKSNRQR